MRVRMALLLAASILVLAPAAGATEDTLPQTQNSPTIATPEAVKTNPFSGSAAYAYKFDVPPGTGGLTPELVLTNSTATKGSAYGFGWSLNLSTIERSTRYGAPDYVDPSTAVVDVSTGHDVPVHQFELDGEILIRDQADPDRFYKSQSDGSRILYISSGAGHWEVTQPDGTRYLYGSRVEAKSTLASSTYASIPFRWSLDEVIDARGNAYRIDYERHGELEIYPRYVRYSYHYGDQGALESTAAVRLIEFRWEFRGEDPLVENSLNQDTPTTFRPGFAVQIRKRLKEVVVGVVSGPTDTTIDSTEQVRRYVMTYAPKFEAGPPVVARPHSELVEVQRHGRSDGAFPTSVRFEYSTVGTGFKPFVSLGPGEGDETRYSSSTYFIGDVHSQFLDWNGDGFLTRSIGQLGGYDDPATPEVERAGFGPNPDYNPDSGSTIDWTTTPPTETVYGPS